MIKPGILGNRSEKLALKYLKQKGLKLHEKNYHCRYGEIDLIMWHDDYLVFIEVRYRKNNLFGGALESVNHCLLYTSPSPRDLSTSRMPSSA